MIVLLLLLSRRANVWFYAVMGLVVAFFGYYLAQIDFHLFGFGRDPWAYRRGFMALGFIVMGGLYWRYERNIEKWFSKVGLLLLLMLYVVIFSDSNHTARVLISTMDINWMGYLASLLGCVLLISICKLLKPISVLTFIGQNSICFYFLSGALPMIFSMLTKRFIGHDQLWGLLIVFVLSIGVAYAMTFVLVRYLPFVFDLRCINQKKTTR